ncbi:hypothetical protein Pint_09475 [Pistacia integerrima]|uniref:Uncharacterized protein n=1 Tax=Pistacia integerrima TaxID=434235 RepID=A0ACC0XHT6_9ROSI|nr:hypothetical protein Pint_09475 [Pistacia integerrima]
MSNVCPDDRDIESQQTFLVIANDRPRDNWRWIFLVLHARQSLISRAYKTKRRSPGAGNAAVSSSTSSYGVINTCREGNANSEITEIVEELPTSPEVSVDLLRNDPIVSNERLQHANIAQIVKTEDLAALHRFGGVQGIAEALDTDLENGIPGKPTSSYELMEAIKRIISRPSGKVSILTTLLTLVVGIVEGVPFVITLAIFYWNKKALSYKAFAQKKFGLVKISSMKIR